MGTGKRNSRKRKGEKYCVVCDAFEADEDKDFLACKKCQMVNYCGKGHKEEDEARHEEVCGELKAEGSSPA